MPQLRGAAQPPDDMNALVEHNSSYFDKVTHLPKRRVLAAYAICGRIGKAAEIAGVARTLHYHWLKTDPAYVAAFAEAHDLAADSLEDEAIRRAMDGITRTVYHKDQPVGQETVYSDTLLIFMLKGMRPEKYRDTAHIEVSTAVNVALEARTREAAERLKRLREGADTYPAPDRPALLNGDAAAE